MKRQWRTFFAVSLALVIGGCTGNPGPASALKPAGFGAALVESSGGKQIGATGTVLAQPLVVQVNDEQGTAVTGALVEFVGPAGVSFDPPSGLTDSSGQLSTNVALGSMAGRYQLTARISTKAQKFVELKIEEIALGYQQQVGFSSITSIARVATTRSLRRSGCPITTILRSSHTRLLKATH